VALLVTALLFPLLNFLRRRGLPRGWATVSATLIAVAVIGGGLALVIIRAIDQAPQLGDQVNRLIPHVKTWLETGPLHVNATSVNSFSSTLTKEVSKNSSAIASAAVSTGKTVLDILTGVVIAIFVTIFMLYDGDRIWEFVLRGVPAPARVRTDRAGRAAWSTLSHYVRGTLVVALFHGLAIGITLEALRVPLVLPLAVLVGIGSFVPLVGAVVTGIVAAGVATIEQGLGAGIVVVVVMIIDNQLEAHVLQPFVVGRYVRIHPLAIVLALATGAILFGLVGAIVAVPVVACLNSAVRAAMHHPDDP
jgi:predicted PurR-regulated permease PerM